MPRWLKAALPRASGRSSPRQRQPQWPFLRVSDLRSPFSYPKSSSDPFLLLGRHLPIFLLFRWPISSNELLSRVGRIVYWSTRNRRCASAVTVWSGIRTVLSPKSPTLTSAYSAPPLSFKKSLFNLPICPRGSRTQ